MSCWSEINLNEIIIVNLPLSKELLTKLLKLDLTNYKKLSSLPSVICNLTSLNALTLSCCSKLDKMLENFKNLEDLKELNRRGTAIRELPSLILLLKNLKILSL